MKFFTPTPRFACKPGPQPPMTRRSGFSLVETVIACTIVLIAMAGCFLILEASMNLIRSTRDAYAATTITNARLERARMLSYSDLPGLAENGTIVDDYGLPSSAGRFRRTTAVSTNQPAGGCTQIAVTTDVQKPGKTAGTFYNARTMTGVFTPYDSPP